MMTMASSQHLQRQENKGFKLLQEDNVDDRPCSAVKDFVASVLNKKDLKDQDVASSFRNLVEYRDGRRSPTQGFHPPAEGEDLGLLSPPSSPKLFASSKEREERLPNRLLDEMRDDMGMRLGDQMDLDFVEFLMGQGGSSQSFITPEGAGGGGGGGVNVSTASSNISTPSNCSAGFLGDWQNLTQTSSGTAGALAAGETTAVSSNSNSPVRKRIHLSMSEQNSPVQFQQQEAEQQQQLKQHKQQLQPHKPQYHQHVSGSRGSVPSPCYPGQDFKLPLTPLTPANCDLPAQESSAKGINPSVNASASMSLVNSQAKENGFSPRPVMPDGLDSASCGSGSSGGGVHPHAYPSSYQNSASATLSCSHPPRTTHPLPPSSHPPVDHTPQRVKGPGETGTTMTHHHHQQHYPHHHQYQQTPQSGHPGSSAQHHHSQTTSRGTLYHKPCKQASPAVSADDSHHIRWKFPEVSAPVKKLPSSPVQTRRRQEMGKPTYPHPLENTHSGDPGQNPGLIPSVSGENRNPACALSVSLPSSVAGTERGVCVPKPQTAHSGDRDQATHLSYSHQGSLHTQTRVPTGSNHPRFFGDYSHNVVSADSTVVSGYSQMSEPETSFHQHSETRADLYTVPTNCTVADSSTSNSSGFISHSSYPAKPSAGLDAGEGTSSSFVRPPSCEFEARGQSRHIVKNSEQVKYTNHPQCNTESSVVPDAGRSVHSGLHVHTHNRTHFEGMQNVDGSAGNSAQTNTSFSGPGKSNTTGNSYVSNTNASSSLPVNHMRAALQHQETSFSDCGMTNQQSEQHTQHHQWKRPVPHQQLHQQQHGVDGLDLRGQQANRMPADSAQTLHQDRRNCVQQSDALDSFTAQSDLSLQAAMNCQPDTSVQHGRSLSVNVGQNLQDTYPGTNSQNLNMSCKQEVSMSGTGQGISARERMPPPQSPVGFQPSAVSTPVAGGRHGTRPPSQGHRLYGREGPESRVDGGYPASQDGSGAMPHHYDSRTYPGGGPYPPPWAGGHTDPSVPADPAPHPARMVSPHFGQMQQAPYPHTPQSKQFVSTHPSHPGQPPSPSSFRLQSQHTGPSHPTDLQTPFPAHMHAQHSASFRPIDSQGLSSSHHMQPAPSHTLQPQHFSHPAGPSPRLPPPHTVPYSSNPDPSFPAPYPDPNSSVRGGNDHLGPASKAFSAKQKFIQNLILDERNAAYRSHPLFPLLRDLVIAGMNFDDPRFYYQQLLSMLPRDFEKLMQNFLQRNPPAGSYQSNYAVESVLMDSLRLAHASLVEKISARQEEDQRRAMASASMQAVDEFCDKFDQIPVGRMGPGNGMINGYSPAMGIQGPRGDMMMQPSLHIMTPMAGQANFMVALNEGEIMGPVMLQTLNDTGDRTYAGTPKQETKKHPSLPKEAVSLMLTWLKAHKDNPYPNDEEKTLLINQTGLTMNQINYWFTNARRRILPKWSRNSGDNSS